MLGKPDNRFDNWPARITGWLGQKKVLEDKIAGGIPRLDVWLLMLSTDMFDLATKIGSLTVCYQRCQGSMEPDGRNRLHNR